jgi:hypothetical protein
VSCRAGQQARGASCRISRSNQCRLAASALVLYLVQFEGLSQQLSCSLVEQVLWLLSEFGHSHPVAAALSTVDRCAVQMLWCDHSALVTSSAA